MPFATAGAAPASDGASVRVVDGDTIVATIGSSEERVRFLNIDTPEVGTCMADRATEFTTRQLPSGTPIDLRYDRDLRDPYDRLLALVRPAGGDWLSVSLAENGLGFPLTIAPNNAYQGRVEAAAGRARRDGLGMFNPRRSCTPVSRVKRANAVVSEAQSMPVRSRAQYDAVNRRLSKASGILALASAARYGIESKWFAAYTVSVRRPVQRRIASVRTAKTRQWNIVRNSHSGASGGSSSGGSSGGSSSGGSSGSSGGYNGPRCYEPGGLVWHPC